MECKYCKAELEEGSSVCPACGKDNEPVETRENITEEMETEDRAKASVGKLIVAIIAGIALLAVLIGAIVMGLNGSFVSDDETTGATNDPQMAADETEESTIPADGNPDDETCKGTYTVSDEDAENANRTVVATMGDSELTNGLLQIYYWSEFYNAYSDYVTNYGLDMTKPMDVQVSPAGNTWQQTFLAVALEAWQVNKAMAVQAEKAGLELDADTAAELDSLKDSLEAQASENGYASADEMIQSSMGAGCTVDDYMEYVRQYYYGGLYYNNESGKIAPTDDEVADYYKENKELFAENGIEEDSLWVDVRHILIYPEGGTTDDSGSTTYTEDEWNACEVAAQKLLDQWAAGEATEDSFAALANEHSEDPGSNTNGGLYEDVTEGTMVSNFNDWCFDASRQTGDTGLVRTPFGYHIMYFVGSDYIWQYYARENLILTKQNEIITNALNAAELQVDYSKIVLAEVDLLGED